MSKTIYCDKCKQEIISTSYEVLEGFNKNHIDLCKKCYDLFKEFLKEKPHASE